MTVAERYGRFLSSAPSTLESSREQWRGFSLMFYAGKNGSGKSLAAVYDTLPDLAAGTTVLSTVRLLDWENPRPCGDLLCPCDKDNPNRHGHMHPSCVIWTNWAQFLELREGVVLADEITGIASATESAGLPAQAADELHRLRARDVVMRMTGISFARAAKVVREAAKGVTRCSGSMPVPAVDEHGRTRMWRPNRLAEWVTYDAEELPQDDITEAAFEKADKKVSARLWVPDNPAIAAYDTYAAVSRVGAWDSAGNCARCGGRRPREECSCDDYLDRKAAKARRVASRSARKARSAEHTPPADLSGLPELVDPAA